MNPKPGSRIAKARDYGIDLTLLVENLRLSPAERLRNNEQAVNGLLKFEEAMKKTKKSAGAKFK